MKRSLLLLSLLLVFGTAISYAQGGGQRGQRRQGMQQRMPEPEEMAKRRAQMFQEQFGLSDDQYKKTYDIFLKSAKEVNEKMKQLMADRNREGIRKAMDENRENTDKKLKEVLTAEQWTLYEKWKKDNPPMQRRRGGGN